MFILVPKTSLQLDGRANVMTSAGQGTEGRGLTCSTCLAQQAKSHRAPGVASLPLPLFFLMPWNASIKVKSLSQPSWYSSLGTSIHNYSFLWETMSTCSWPPLACVLLGVLWVRRCSIRVGRAADQCPQTAGRQGAQVWDESCTGGVWLVCMFCTFLIVHPRSQPNDKRLSLSLSAVRSLSQQLGQEEHQKSFIKSVVLCFRLLG